MDSAVERAPCVGMFAPWIHFLCPDTRDIFNMRDWIAPSSGITCLVFLFLSALSIPFDWTFEILSMCLLFCFVCLSGCCVCDVVCKNK